jgi:RHS repeat-associated protein
LRFSGQHADSESGYRYDHFRNYDATLGRCIQADPIGLADGTMGASEG